MHDCRPELAKYSVQLRKQFQRVPRSLLEREEQHVIALHARGELIGHLIQGDDGMSPTVAWKAVHEIDDAVLQPTSRKAVDDVDDEGTICAHVEYVLSALALP